MYYTINPFTGALWASESSIAARESILAQILEANSVGRLGQVSQFFDHNRFVVLTRPAMLAEPLDFPLG